MQRRNLGDIQVSAIGLGAMPLSLEDRPSREQAVSTIHAALDAGITLIDTADAYCTGAEDTGHNERLVADALRSWSGDRESVIVATKGGHFRLGDGSWHVNGTPDYLRSACEASREALGVDVIDLYQFHRPDPGVPVAESVGALADLQREGKVRFVGVSNFSARQLDEVASLVDLVSVQNEFSPAFRRSQDEVRHCEERGIAFLAWSPLGGMGAAADLANLHPAFADVAAELEVSAHQVALAWELHLSPAVIPIPGASRPATITDSAQADDLVLTEDQLSRLAAG